MQSLTTSLKTQTITTIMTYLSLLLKQQLSHLTLALRLKRNSRDCKSAPGANVRRRALPTARQRFPSTLWVASPCLTSISVHYNAIDRELCAQTLREHHTVLERAMVRLYPRFKWGRSNYLQVLHCCNISPYILVSYL